MGLIGHFKANTGVTLVGGKVSAWADQSGNSNDLEQTVDAARPLFVASGFNGHPTLRFSGAQELVGTSSSILQIAGIFATIAVACIPNTGSTISMVAKRNGEDGYLLRILSNTRASVHWTENSDRRYAVQSSVLSNDGVFTIYHADVHSSISPFRNIYIDGVLDNDVNINEQVPSNLATSTIPRIGSNEGGSFFDGDIFEIKIYEDQLVDKTVMFDDLNVYSTPLNTAPTGSYNSVIQRA